MKKTSEEKKRSAATDKSMAPSCDVCRKEVSQSTAVTSEGKDYIWHFCNQDCYKSWQGKHGKKN